MDDEVAGNIEVEVDQDDANRKGKSLGLPELDPDALPSSLVSKYLILECILDFKAYFLQTEAFRFL